MVTSSKIIGRRYGVIDVGTNSVLCLIGELDTPTHFNVIEDRAAITRIGEGIATSKTLKQEAIDRTINCVKDFTSLCRTFHVDELLIVGTSALRQAQNSNVFAQAVKETTGLGLEIISGHREAELSFVAVSNEFPHFQDDFIVLDIGGGSSEFIFGNPNDLCSVDLGCVRLTEKVLASDPPSSEELDKLYKCVQKEVEKTFSRHIQAKKLKRVIGVAGTVTTLAAVEQKMSTYDRARVHGYELTKEKIKDQIGLYSTTMLEDRKRIIGLKPERADVILAGAVIALTVIDVLGLKSMIVSDYGLRHGLIYEKILT